MDISCSLNFFLSNEGLDLQGPLRYENQFDNLFFSAEWNLRHFPIKSDFVKLIAEIVKVKIRDNEQWCSLV